MPEFSHCAYCQRELYIVDDDDAMGDEDHVIPKDRGGCECKQNKVDFCLTCKQEKNTMTPLEFYNSLLEDSFDEGGYTLQQRQDFLLQAAYWEARARLHLSNGCAERQGTNVLANFH